MARLRRRSRMVPVGNPMLYAVLVAATSAILQLLFVAAVNGAPASGGSSSRGGKQTYIVHLRGSVDGGDTSAWTEEQAMEGHHTFLLSVKDSVEDARSSLLYSYHGVFNGFAASLTKEEADSLSAREEVISMFPSRPLSLHTTRSWDFIQEYEGSFSGRQRHSTPEAKQTSSQNLPLPSTVAARDQQDIIVGVLDSGIWPESESFQDDGMGPVPAKWKGICQQGEAFKKSHCNRKLIGARYYLKDYEARFGPLNTSYAYRSPRDHDGHGTHTASTAVGRAVPNTSALGGFAKGTATGGLPMARVAVYKVCWPLDGENPNMENTCYEADMLKAFADAVADGVDVLSVSIGAHLARENISIDAIALGSLKALKKGVVVVTSAGNDGPVPGTVVNLAPWLLTVAASSIDRAYPAPVLLGNGKAVMGQTVTVYHLGNESATQTQQQQTPSQYPLIFAGDGEVPGVPTLSSGQCLPNSLDSAKVKGKVVLCLRGLGLRTEKGEEVKRAGGAAIVLGNSAKNGREIPVDSHVIPGTAVAPDGADAIRLYANSTRMPTASLAQARTVLGVRPAPVMASFTSRGPNPVEPGLLKPDVTAPGLNILAAWTGALGPTKLTADKRVVKYNIYSGTSMACPHVSAAAARIRSAHPTWSSAAIRSAIMTTASIVDILGSPIAKADGGPASPFELGAGHLRPTYAVDPGLVYDASYKDYVLFGCSSLGYQYDHDIPCPAHPPAPYNLNHPSVAVGRLSGVVTVKRTLTNVGSAGEVTYRVLVDQPPGIKMKISPRVLRFSQVGDQKSFKITVRAKGNRRMRVASGEYAFGSFTWTDGVHQVRSPVAVALA